MGLSFLVLLLVAQPSEFPTEENLVEWFNKSENVRLGESRLKAELKTLKALQASVKQARISERPNALVLTFRTREEKETTAEKLELLVQDVTEALELGGALLATRIPIDGLAPGMIGRLVFSDGQEVTKAKVAQVVDRENLLCELGEMRFWLAGFNTSSLTDETMVSLERIVFKVAGNKTYVTAIGGSRTVFELRVFDLEPYGKKAVQARSRIWTDASGKHRTEATAIEKTATDVLLRKGGGAKVRVSISSLSGRDKRFLNKYVDER